MGRERTVDRLNVKRVHDDQVSGRGVLLCSIGVDDF
jgi:hypothetical protein